MTSTSFTTSFAVDRSPQQVYDAINDVRAWWSAEIDGPTDVEGEAFTFRVKDLHRSLIRVTEVVPGRRVVWTVLENDMSFVEDQTEWVTHVGLLADHECYDVCSKAWTYYLTESLPNLVTTGAGRPEGEPEDALRGPEPSSIRG
jgi:hypothetical protein